MIVPFKGLYITGIACAVLTACSLDSESSKDSVSADDNLLNNNIRGWELVWSDEFNGKRLDDEKWIPEISCWGGGNNERQCYTGRPSNINVSDGVLKLTAKTEHYTGPKYPQDWKDRGGNVTQSYTSGKVRTKGLASWQYGRFEARIKLPQGQSTWPAFWMLPENNDYGEWPLSGEIDIMEAVNLGATCNNCENSTIENRSSVTLHFGKLWPDNQFRTQKYTLPKGPEAYYIFAMEWSEGQMDWYVDDQKIFTMTQNDWFSGAVDKASNNLAPFDQPFYLMLNLAVGGNLPDTQNEKAFTQASFPNELLVDWVRVYHCKADIETARDCVSQ